MTINGVVTTETEAIHFKVEDTAEFTIAELFTGKKETHTVDKALFFKTLAMHGEEELAMALRAIIPQNKKPTLATPSMLLALKDAKLGHPHITLLNGIDNDVWHEMGRPFIWQVYTFGDVEILIDIAYAFMAIFDNGKLTYWGKSDYHHTERYCVLLTSYTGESVPHFFERTLD